MDKKVQLLKLLIGYPQYTYVNSVEKHDVCGKCDEGDGRGHNLLPCFVRGMGVAMTTAPPLLRRGGAEVMATFPPSFWGVV